MSAQQQSKAQCNSVDGTCKQQSVKNSVQVPYSASEHGVGLPNECQSTPMDQLVSKQVNTNNPSPICETMHHENAKRKRKLGESDTKHCGSNPPKRQKQTKDSDLYKISYKDVLRSITNSKSSCIEFLQAENVISRSMNCPGPIVDCRRVQGCGKPMKLRKTSDRKDAYVWRCRKVHKFSRSGRMVVTKDVKVSVRENSWLLDAKLPLEVAIEFIYLWSQGLDTVKLQHECKLSNKTVIEWSAYLREVCMSTIMDRSHAIGGENVIVEIDESKFGKRKYFRGHRVEGQWVFGGRERLDTGKVFMIPVMDRKTKTLLPIIKRWILPGSIIHSDCWKAYTCLSKEGYTHVTVNHSKEFKNEKTGACTNSIESDWRHAKVNIPRYGVHKGFHAGYLAEFMWRRKYQDCDKFKTLIGHLTESYQSEKMQPFPSEVEDLK